MEESVWVKECAGELHSHVKKDVMVHYRCTITVSHNW